MSLCQACARPGATQPVLELRAELCVSCDIDYAAWRDAHPWCIATDWPAWNRLGLFGAGAQAARDAVRDRDANTTNTRPLTADQRDLVEAWHAHQAGAAR